MSTVRLMIPIDGGQHGGRRSRRTCVKKITERKIDLPRNLAKNCNQMALRGTDMTRCLIR